MLSIWQRQHRKVCTIEIYEGNEEECNYISIIDYWDKRNYHYGYDVTGDTIKKALEDTKQSILKIEKEC